MDLHPIKNFLKKSPFPCEEMNTPVPPPVAKLLNRKRETNKQRAHKSTKFAEPLLLREFLNKKRSPIIFFAQQEWGRMNAHLLAPGKKNLIPLANCMFFAPHKMVGFQPDLCRHFHISKVIIANMKK